MTLPVDAIRAFAPELIAIRHDSHCNPEMGFEKTQTAVLVAKRLRTWGLRVTKAIARIGVVATLMGKRAGQRSIRLRADLDALPLDPIDASEGWPAAYPIQLARV